MRYKTVLEKLLEETKAIVRLYLFLQHDCGLKIADKLSHRELEGLLYALEVV